MRKLAILLTMLCAVVGLGLYATSSGFSSPWAPTRTATPTAGDDESSTAFIPQPDRWYRVAVTSSASAASGRANRVWEVYRTTGFTPAPASSANAQAGTNRLLTNVPDAAPNDWQLFKFVKGSGENEGKYAILSKATGKYLSDDGKNSGSQPGSRFDFKSDKPVYGFWLKDNAITSDGKYESRIYLTDPADGSSRKMLNCAASPQGYAVNYYTSEDASKCELFTFTEVVEETFSYATNEKETMDHNKWESFKFGIRPIQLTIEGTDGVDYYSDQRALAVKAGKTVKVSTEDGYYISKLTLGVTKAKENVATTVKICDGTATPVTANFGRANAVEVEYVNTDPEKEITITAGTELVTLWVTKVQLTRKAGAETITFPLSLSSIDHNAEMFPEGTTWYRMYLRNNKNKFVRYDGASFAYVGENPADGIVPGDLWCMEPVEEGIRFYNYSTGASKIISGTTAAMELEPIFESTNDKWAEWIVYLGSSNSEADPYYYVRARFGTGNSNLYWNDNGNTHFGYWNSTYAATDGGSQVRFIEYTGEMPELPEVSYPVVVEEDEAMTRTDRSTSSITVTTSAGEQTISPLQSSTDRKIFWNFADIDEPTILTASPGDEVTFDIGFSGKSMHKIVYVDWDKNGFNGAAHTSFAGYPDGIAKKASGDMVYGVHQTNNSNSQSATYTIPDNIALGQYRIRFKVDWDGNANGVNATTMPAGNPGQDDADKTNRITTNGGIIVDAILEIVEPVVEEFEPDPDKWYRLTAMRAGTPSDSRNGRSLEAYHADMSGVSSSAQAQNGRLLTSDATATFNDYQLFRFEMDETTGAYAIYNKGTRNYLNTNSSTGATTRLDFGSSTPVYGFWISGTTKGGDGQSRAEIHLTNPSSGAQKPLNCAQSGQGFAINSYNPGDAAKLFVFTEMEPERQAVTSYISKFLNGATFDVGSGWGNNVTTNETSEAPVRISLTSQGKIGYSSKGGDRVVQVGDNAVIVLEAVDAPADYYITKVTMSVGSSSNNASGININGNETVEIPGGNSSASRVVSSTVVAGQPVTVNVTGPSILIWDVTVEFSCPFSAETRKTETAERIRKLGNMMVFGFDSETATQRANEVLRHTFDESATSEEVMEWCAGKFIDYVKTADYGSDNALFHISSVAQSGALAIDRDGVADLYDAMSIYALWNIYPVGDGAINLFNPMSGKWLAIEGANITVVDNQVDATPLYIGGSNRNDLGIFTTYPADYTNAIVASSATTIGMGGATTNVSGPDHWTVTKLSDADCERVLNVTRQMMLADLDIYEKVPALWSAGDLAQVRTEVDQVTMPTGLSVATLFEPNEGWALYEADLQAAMGGIKEKCVGVSFYLTQKTPPTDGTQARIASVNSANNLVRVASLDNTCIFNIAEVSKDGAVKISYTNADGTTKYLARSGNAYVANDQGTLFEIVVSPKGNTGAYGENEVALLDPQGGFINRTGGVNAYNLGNWGSDDDGSRWYITAVNDAQAAADIEAEREAAIAKLEQLRDVPFFWSAENMDPAIEEVKALTFDTKGLNPSEAVDAVLAAREAFNEIIVKARATIAGIRFAAYNGTGNNFGYLSSRQDGAQNTSGLYLTQQSEITGPTAEWVLTLVDETVPTFTISGPAAELDEDGNAKTCYIKSRPTLDNTSWELTYNESEAGQFKVMTVGVTGKVVFISYPNSGDETDHATIHNATWSGRTDDIVRWTPNAENSQWTIMGLSLEDLQDQLDLDVAEARKTLDNMRQLSAIWTAGDIDEAEAKITDFSIDPDSEFPLNDYVDITEQINDIIEEVSQKATTSPIYFISTQNRGILSVGNADDTDPGKLYRLSTETLTNGCIFTLIPDGTGFKIYNEASGRYISGNPGTSQRWQTTDNADQAATLYLDPSFCNNINQTGISTVSTPGATGMYFIHANAGDPVCWSGNNDSSRWLIASASDADVEAAKYIRWLEDAKSASPWGAYTLIEGIKALKSAVGAGNATADQIKAMYEGTVATVEQTIASSGQDAEVIISHHPSGHILVNAGSQIEKQVDNRQDTDLNNNVFAATHRWKLVAKEGSPNLFHIQSMAAEEDGNYSYIAHFNHSAGEQTVMGGMATTEDEKMAAVISLKEGRLVFADGESAEASTRSVRTLADGDGEEEVAEPEYWVIGLYQPNTLMPEPSTAEAPKLYYIRNVDNMRQGDENKRREYLTAGGGNSGAELRLFKDPQPASLWYVTDNGNGTYKIRSAYYTDLMIKHSKSLTTDALDASSDFYIKECTNVPAARGIGLYISTTPDLSGTTCLDRGVFRADDNSKDIHYTFDLMSDGYSPRNVDYQGTAWVFTPVSENDEVAYFEEVKESHYNASRELIEYFRSANPWCWSAFDQADSDLSANLAPSNSASFGDALRDLEEAKALEQLKVNFSSMLDDELAGKTFIMFSVARRLNIPNVPTARIGVNTTGAVAIKDGATDQNDAFTFMPSEKAGYFYIYNGEGKFISASGNRQMVDNINNAGRFTLELHYDAKSPASNFYTCLLQDNGNYLSIAANGNGIMTTANSGGSNSTGFEFERYYPAPSGIEDVVNDAPVTAPALTGEAELYDLRGSRINPANAAPGIYILRQGTRAIKIRIR